VEGKTQPRVRVVVTRQTGTGVHKWERWTDSLWQHHHVLFAYVDESGDTGDVAKSGASLSYSLGCVLIAADCWPAAFDEILAFRRRLKQKFGLPMRAELKANYLLRNSGPLRPLNLGPGARRTIYRAHMRVMSALPARVFAVVVDKRTKRGMPAAGVFDLAWEGLLQRLERTSTKEDSTFIVIHDEGDDENIRKWVRRSRRYLTAGSAYGIGSRQLAARLLVDDPVSRRSHQSYLVQSADLVAYAGFRALIPPGPGVAAVCHQDTWDELGTAIHRPVTMLKQPCKPGVVVR
jgi:hypothetical protein